MDSRPGSSRPPTLSTTLITFAEQDVDIDHLFAIADAADRAGIDRLLVSDHVVFGDSLDDYGRPELGGISGGRQPTGPDGHWLEPLTVLTAVAARTKRIRLGTNIVLAALRRPAVLAKTIATLDVISRGRVDLGVGIGWQRAEYDAAGLPFGRRGDLLDHTLAVLRTLWSQTSADFTDDRLTFTDIHQMPKPSQPEGVPIWIGGSLNPRTARRIARFGDGWIPWGDAARDVIAALPVMRRMVESEGGDHSQLSVAANLSWVRDDAGEPDLSRTMHAVPELIDAGVTDLRIRFPMVTDVAEASEVFESTVRAFREVAG